MNYTLWDPNIGNVPFSQALQQTLAGITGNQWWVNEVTGSDGYPGTMKKPFASLGAAQNAAAPGNGDAVMLQGSNHQSVNQVWSKNNVSIIGVNAPSNNNRARVSVQTGLTQGQVTALTTLMSVTAQGCSFINVGAFYGFDGSLNPPTTAPATSWSDTGGRNYYGGCQFIGFGDVKTAVLANARALVLGGGNGESVFDSCTFGGDTEVRATNANATVEFLAGGAFARAVFRDCIFEADSSDASNLHILVSSGGIDRYALFKRCTFHNFNATAMSAAVSNLGGSPSGNVILQDPASVGATALATTGNVFVTGNVPIATTSGIAILAT
jgi:hypothetical protein